MTITTGPIHLFAQHTIRRILPAAALLWLAALGAVQAAQVQGLYQAQVPVASQATGERNQAVRQAFEQVLVKVAGNRRLLARDDVQALLGQASRYVQQFKYLARPAALEGEPAERLQVRFDKFAVDRALRERRIGVWGAVRPSLLVWVGIEQDGQRRLLVPDLQGDAAGALIAGADARGLPLLLPLMDLQDQAALNTSDLWGEFVGPLRTASERYTPDLTASVRATRLSANLWRAEWTLYLGDSAQRWQSEAASLPLTLSSGLDQLVDRLAERYAPSGGGSAAAGLLVRVSGVDTLDDFLRLRSLLDQQESVSSYQLRHARSDAVVLELELRGGRAAFEQAIALSGVLQPAPEELEPMPIVAPQPEPAPLPASAAGLSPAAAEAQAAGEPAAAPVSELSAAADPAAAVAPALPTLQPASRPALDRPDLYFRLR